MNTFTIILFSLILVPSHSLIGMKKQLAEEATSQDKTKDKWVIKSMGGDDGTPFCTILEDQSEMNTIELIKRKQFGPELARKLDIEWLWDGYKYDKNGIYRREGGGVFQHSVVRHLCEPGVTEAEAEKKHQEMEPPSYRSPDGTLHYAIMH